VTTEKIAAPPYVSFKSFMNFMNARREDGHTTTVVDKTLMSNLSGSTANELLQAIKYLKLIKDSGEANPAYEEFVRASDEEREVLMKHMIHEAYPYIWTTPGFDLERATSGQMADVFRGQNVNGSTLTRAVVFFLAAAQLAGIKVSPSIKAQPRPKTSSSKSKKDKESPGTQIATTKQHLEEHVPSGTQSFEIPIPINRKVKINIPAEWSAADWDLFQQMLGAYITGWKAMMPDKKEE
jgi:hypothetical protein